LPRFDPNIDVNAFLNQLLAKVKPEIVSNEKSLGLKDSPNALDDPKMWEFDSRRQIISIFLGLGDNTSEIESVEMDVLTILCEPFVIRAKYYWYTTHLTNGLVVTENKTFIQRKFTSSFTYVPEKYKYLIGE